MLSWFSDADTANGDLLPVKHVAELLCLTGESVRLGYLTDKVKGARKLVELS